LSFGNKNLETKIKILFRIKKSRIENNTFQKKKSRKEIIMFRKWKSGKKIQNTYFRNFFRTGSSFQWNQVQWYGTGNNCLLHIYTVFESLSPSNGPTLLLSATPFSFYTPTNSYFLKNLKSIKIFKIQKYQQTMNNKNSFFQNSRFILSRVNLNSRNLFK